MKLLSLSIRNFRGIQCSNITFNTNNVLIGPNGSGKSTIIDSLSLVFGRTRLVRDLTEHDFYGSNPEEKSRIHIIATLGGFSDNDPNRYENWFREGRAVPKWWNSHTEQVEPTPGEETVLCAQIAFAARFDLEELVVETIRYFHDDDSITDPFLDDTIQQVPIRLYDEIGYYVLPARRTWEAAASFASELFRKAVATVGGIPATTILNERNRLRRPNSPLEKDHGLHPLVDRINKQLGLLLPTAPKFQLRITGTDSESLLRALVPHYEAQDGLSLPVGRHGMGLLSLQTFILLLELGRERRRQGKPFLFAMEEPELHIPPGMQRRLVAQAVTISNQTICTSHSPRVASYYPSTSVQILNRRSTKLASTVMLRAPLDDSASNAERKFYHDDRPRVIEALMYHRILVPEGRSEYEWLRMLSDTLEIGDLTLQADESDIPPFGATIGVIPTHDSAVTKTYRMLRKLRKGIIPIVDGDDAGNSYVDELLSSGEAPAVIIQWREGWMIEDVIGWILKGEEQNALEELRKRIDREFTNIDELMNFFKLKVGPGRLKADFLAYEEVTSIIGRYRGSRERAGEILKSLTQVSIGRYEENDLVEKDEGRSSEQSILIRVKP